ncbi:hypothetical protein [Helicobacter cappadocius]|uniref:Uncharacterized protein n=1 Tax=Helicobacter cappadocius TaxID=3063998 RepID=A0AA90PIC3_9HELI|nr:MULTISPECIES: hypothetical protein [unclassified Helicobacter]MDO7253072.1 hypothetical protein [Helicobacter sp. faydin-H75]MDP2538802.1 hypothetical protein [Helicobacter sp. faydin-H76]
MSELEIFELGLALAKALGGDKEAIADIALLYRRHPEMFENFQDVVKTIEEVIKDPEIIMKNPKAKNDQDFIVAKKLNEKKMGDIGIRNEDGINMIFHANKINVKKFKQFEKKQLMVGTPNSYTQAQSLDERLVQKHISSPARDILPQTDKSQETQKSQLSNTQKPKYKENENESTPNKPHKRR